MNSHLFILLKFARQRYDFGDCGDECDEDVVRCFEQFINAKSNNEEEDQPTSDNAP